MDGSGGDRYLPGRCELAIHCCFVPEYNPIFLLFYIILILENFSTYFYTVSSVLSQPILILFVCCMFCVVLP